MPTRDELKEEIQLVIFKIGKEEFAVGINQVREIVRLIPITPIPRVPDFIEGVVNLRGQIIAVVDLAKRLEIAVNPRTDRSRIMVVDVEDSTVGMIVDEVAEVLRIASENIKETPGLVAGEIQQKYLQGVGKLGDRLLILIDLSRIFSLEEVKELEATSKVIEENKSQEKGGE